MSTATSRIVAAAGRAPLAALIARARYRRALSGWSGERHAGRHADLDQPRPVGADALAQRLGELLAAVHAARLHAIRARHAHGVERRQVEAGRAGDRFQVGEPLED